MKNYFWLVWGVFVLGALSASVAMDGTEVTFWRNTLVPELAALAVGGILGRELK